MSEAVPHKADAISEERKWVDLKDTSSGAGDALTDGDGAGRTARTGNSRFEKRTRNNPVIIDKKYSLEANQATHAILSSKPRQLRRAQKGRPEAEKEIPWFVIF